ncbi:MAG: DUF4411 family protein [Betaproteobacteria bacterium]|nr:DUF4411 family protein [Betaproteobacteria bacterium]
MSDGAPQLLYSVDSSSFMDWQARYYPIDVFASIVGRADDLIAANRLFAPALVKEELSIVGTGDLNTWAKARPRIFVPTGDLLVEAQAIQNAFPGLRDPKAEFEEADAYVIALAKIRGGIVITQETPAAEKRNPKRSHFIPDVCREIGIPCFNLLGMMRRENWVF